MRSYLRAIIKKSLILFFAALPVFVFAQEKTAGSGNRGVLQSTLAYEEKKPRNVTAPSGQPLSGLLSQLQSEAREYREIGMRFQNSGNIDAAQAYYEKAAEFDPAYAVVYNDLGVIYEAKGEIDRAEENYLTALKIDPGFLSAFTNLALFYENKRDLVKASYYWGKRASLGAASDPWTNRAARRLEDIRLVSTMPSLGNSREQEVIELVKDVASKKPAASFKKEQQEKTDNKKILAQRHFTKAKKCFDKKDYSTAIKEALDAQQLDPDNEEIEAFTDKALHKALSK